MLRRLRSRVVWPLWVHVRTMRPKSVRRVLDGLATRAFAYEMELRHLDSHQIRSTAERRELRSIHRHSPQQPSNFNAPEPCPRFVLLLFRVMVDDDIL